MARAGWRLDASNGRRAPDRFGLGASSDEGGDERCGMNGPPTAALVVLRLDRHAEYPTSGSVQSGTSRGVPKQDIPQLGGPELREIRYVCTIRRPDCDSGRRGFESHQPPQLLKYLRNFYARYRAEYLSLPAIRQHRDYLAATGKDARGALNGDEPVRCGAWLGP